MSTSTAPAALTRSDDTGLRTLPHLVRDRAAEIPDAVAMRHKDLGIWQEITWSDYWETVLTTAHALLALGIRPGDRLGIQSEDRPEWLYLDLAAAAVRSVSVGLYPTNPAAEVQYLLTDSGSRLHFAEDQEQLDKFLEVADECPTVEHVVYVDGRGISGPAYTDDRLLPWHRLQEIGAEHRAAHPGAVEDLMAQIEPDDVITLVYTSGTTGPPKGAMLTVRNVDFAMHAVLDNNGFITPPPGPKDLTLSYLPLCHVAERFFTTWFNAGAGTQVNFAESIDTVPQNLREVQPTILLAVPRIWEKLMATARIKIDSASRFKRAYGRFWLRQADKIGDTLAANGGDHTTSSRLLYAVGWVLFFRALRERLGLRRVRYAVCGAAPVAPEVLKFFMGIGLRVVEVYGMTENSAIGTSTRPGRVKLNTVGEPLEGAEVKLDEQTGEILTRHPGNFAGYWGKPDATAEALDADGWLHTGDVGEWVDGTHLRITDRMKDIIITAGGKNVSPSEIENALKASPYVKEAVVIGDGRRYLTALVGIELDTVGDWAQRKGLAFTTYRDLAEKPEVLKLVGDVVKDVNSRFSSVEQIKEFRMLPKELDHEDGELTATQKVKRSAIDAAYHDLVQSMYPQGG